MYSRLVKQKTTVTILSSEAEYVVLSSTTSEMIWTKEDLKQSALTPIAMYEDNRWCSFMSSNLEIKRARHIDIKHSIAL